MNQSGFAYGRSSQRHFVGGPNGYSTNRPTNQSYQPGNEYNNQAVIKIISVDKSTKESSDQSVPPPKKKKIDKSVK